MTLPVASNGISLSMINTESGVAAGAGKGLSWLSANIKGGASAAALSAAYGLAWYTKNNAAQNCTTNMGGQCNCDNCATSQGNNAGMNVSHANCYQYGACSNCNCDNRSWLQANCNCGFSNCAYNCYYSQCTACANCK